jgi:hypothetical protein
MKIQHSAVHILAITAMTFVIAPAMAQGTSSTIKTDMPPVSGNVYMPAGQQNQTGGPMGETGTTLQYGVPAARATEPVRAVAQAPVRTIAPAPAPVAAPAPAPVAAAPVPAPMPAPPVRRARADRG